MTRIGFLGLGRMGSLMAGRLVAAGHEVTVWNRTVHKAAPLVQAGARAAATPAEAVADADVVITMLTGPAAVDAVLFGEHGAAAALGPATTLVEMSTIGPDHVASLHDRLPDVDLADAPVKGSLPAAAAGELAILFGGDSQTLARVREVLEVLGKVQHVGPLGAGAAVKLVVNVALCGSFVLVGEALALGDRLGLSTDTTMTALSGTALGSLVPRVRARLDDPQAPTQFSYGLAAKDLKLAIEAGAPAEGVIAAAHQQFATELPRLSESDIGEIVAVLRRAAAR
ncbi:NAD(P)-dependent oxidoreductase [Micromonospora sp. WMMD961]|uniref:NAD(P)-dependent oxidoreductase n=1 Tax=Micromonospora sp. WMMD961 TaxID=3016100 RepID=UPI0024177D9D|nr:NAD(P)-dependent oxidoreductase [Micromonospora sp. WMMD961]MDG4780084.1 NAD(P)-dependent oxidoreductase [Micromonospora sp. WMMD961]